MHALVDMDATYKLLAFKQYFGNEGSTKTAWYMLCQLTIVFIAICELWHLLSKSRARTGTLVCCFGGN